jgi:hypothetical protein
MKKLVLTMSGLVLVVIVMAQELAMHSASGKNLAVAEASFNWTATVFDFGQIKINTPVTHEFRFTNTGDVPLVISSVQASCGCTIASFSEDPIAPGGEGFVKGTYNAAKLGQFTKSITVNANTADGVVQLTIKGEVTE